MTPSFGYVPRSSQNGQAVRAPTRPDPREPNDPRDVLASWIPSTGSDGAVETLDHLPGLARASEVWEPHSTEVLEPDPEFGERALLHVHSSSPFDASDADEPRWRGPDPLELALERQFG